MKECNECFEVLPANTAYFYAVKDRKTKFRSKCIECCRMISRQRRKPRTVGDTKAPKNTVDAMRLASRLGLLFLSDEYKKSEDKYVFKCSCGEIFSASYLAVRQGQRCSECGLKSVRERNYNGIEWLRKIFDDGGNVLLDTEYRGANHKYRYICDCGNIHSITPYSYRDGTRCRDCGKRKLTGENNPMWNPNLTEEDRLGSRNYPEYVEWREKVRENHSYVCFLCGDGGEVVHHIVPYSRSKELRTEESNGVLLCRECHEEVHRNISLVDMNFESFSTFGEYLYPSNVEKEVDYDHELGEVCYNTIIS